MTERLEEPFVFRFKLDLPVDGEAVDVNAELELREFARRQVTRVLAMVELYQGGRRVSPDQFGLISRPGQRWPIRDEPNAE